MQDHGERRCDHVRLVALTALCVGFLIGVLVMSLLVFTMLYISRLPTQIVPYNIQGARP